jgi:hypothetical protein
LCGKGQTIVEVESALSYEYQQPTCKFCSSRINWNKNARLALGIKGPLNIDGSPHNCRGNAQKELFCKYGCGTRITFDDNEKSDSGKMIPLDFDTKAHHRCDKNPWTRDSVTTVSTEDKVQAPEGYSRSNVFGNEDPGQY